MMKYLIFTLALLSLPKYLLAKDEGSINPCGGIMQSSYTSLNLVRNGAGRNNVIQGIALDQKNNFLYTLHVTGKPEAGVINRFDYTDTVSAIAISTQLQSKFIGHQGVSVNPIDGSLYSSAGTEVKNRGWYITRFTFSAGSKPLNLKIIKAFGDGYSKTTNSMPTFTPSGDILIVRGRKNGKNVLRLYDHNKIKDDDDLSSSFIVEWGVDAGLTKDGYHFQAITADDSHIYILSGKDDLLPKRLFTYDFNGNLINKEENIVIGWDIAATTGMGTHWEPEGLSYDYIKNKLLIAFSVGDKGNRKAIVFFISKK